MAEAQEVEAMRPRWAKEARDAIRILDALAARERGQE